MAEAFPVERVAHPEDQIEEESEEKMREINAEWEKNEDFSIFFKVFFYCPPMFEGLAMPLAFIFTKLK